jgi:hypothetical protein
MGVYVFSTLLMITVNDSMVVTPVTLYLDYLGHPDWTVEDYFGDSLANERQKL